jgi:cell wall-associated NlpC family hydrolase
LVYRTHGISILRDASQQAEMGEEVHFLENVEGGELAFFGDEESISHVGIMIDSSTIIHASGEVKIEKIDTEGIYSDKLGKHTHKLRFIKAF